MSVLFVQVERVEDLIVREDDCFTQPKQKPKPPATNYDLPISKSPEELAAWLAEEKNCSWNDGFYGSDGVSENDLLDWLKQPVEEEGE